MISIYHENAHDKDKDHIKLLADKVLKEYLYSPVFRRKIDKILSGYVLKNNIFASEVISDVLFLKPISQLKKFGRVDG